MMLIDQIQNARFSPVQQSVADYILEHPETIEFLTMKDLALETYTSPATVLRFIQKLGFDSYTEFRSKFVHELHHLQKNEQSVNADLPFSEKESLQQVCIQIEKLAEISLQETLELIDYSSLQKLIRKIDQCRILYVFGISYSLLMGEQLRLDMKRIGKIVQIEAVPQEQKFALATITSKDLALFISYSGQTRELTELASALKSKGIFTAAISSVGDNELKQYSNLVLECTTREKMYSKIGGFASEFSIRLLLDWIYAGVFRLRYQDNLQKRISVSRKVEAERKPTNAILREDLDGIEEQ